MIDPDFIADFLSGGDMGAAIIELTYANIQTCSRSLSENSLIPAKKLR